MTCTHEPAAYLFGRQLARDLPVWASTRDVIRVTRQKLKPEALRAESRDNRHSIIRAGIDYIRGGREIVDTFRL